MLEVSRRERATMGDEETTKSNRKEYNRGSGTGVFLSSRGLRLILDMMVNYISRVVSGFGERSVRPQRERRPHIIEEEY